MIRIILTGDNHLNRYYDKMLPKRLEERRRRLRRAFRRTVEEAIERGVHLYLHVGDLFDTPTPRNVERYAVAKLFNLLREHGIRAFAIGGNHDTPKMRTQEGGVLPHQIIAELGGMTLFSSREVIQPTVLEIKGLRVAVGGLTFDPLLGSGDNPLEGKAFSTSADLGILLLHYSVEGHIYPAVDEPILGLEAIDALEGVNLFAVGHVHKHAHFRLGDKYVVIPGATERLTFGQDETSGFVYIEATKGGIEKLEYIPLESQPREELVVRTPELDPEEPTASILRRLEPISHPDKMVKLRLEGPLLRDVYHRLDFGRLREWGMSHNFFFDVDCTVLKLEDEHHRSGARGARISLLEELLFTADRCIAEAGDEEERELLVESKLAIQRFFEQGW